MAWYHLILIVLILASLLFSVIYSFRYRRQTEPQLRGLFAARMNIAMGILLIALALAQLLLFDMSSVRLVLGSLLLLLGLFNLFAGLRNHSHYSSKA